MTYSFLHIGCGHLRKEHTIPFFNSPAWNELRFDINPDVRPDLIGSMTDMQSVSSGKVKALYSSHNIEHLYLHEVDIALKEFLRVLADDGFAVITCPDIQAVARHVVQGNLLEPLYESSAGPIAPIDILFGHRTEMEKGNFYMAHRTAFTLTSLLSTLANAGFAHAVGYADDNLNLWVVAKKSSSDEKGFKQFAEKVLAHSKVHFA